MLAAHQTALLMGGVDGIRDVNLIESAIARPYSGYHRPVSRKAAALLHSLALNHGFLDGNKRTALLVLSVFLDRSGYAILQVPGSDLNDEFERLVLDVVEHRIDFEQLASWFGLRLTHI